MMRVMPFADDVADTVACAIGARVLESVTRPTITSVAAPAYAGIDAARTISSANATAAGPL
jgi:hypothetical protein